MQNSLFEFTFDNGTFYDRGILYQYSQNKELQSELQSAFAEFKNKGGIYVGHFSGHVHCDLLQTKNIHIDSKDDTSATEAITNIWTMNDGLAGYTAPSDYAQYLTSTSNKQTNTTDECAFDIVILTKETQTINNEEKTVNKGEMIRIGRETPDTAKHFIERIWYY